MDHSHMGHGDMDMGDGDSPMCSMNMLFTWDTQNLCIIFRSWRVTSTFTLVLSILGVMALTAGYEAIREASRQYEERHATALESTPRSTAQAEEKKGKVIKAAFYAVQVFYSFFIM
ncbi:copper transpport protein [Elasticomyces elasticus]|nr:copper transpport protein [Elasticomyces elasticus]KAK3667517.1 copper transpport protein [Elasticomyces elasticus]KAK4928004.1 copper transpport protein [Elasticomyces elasticus]KAK5762442.1 copper transpport protein [Elasticomyces elasticus]